MPYLDYNATTPIDPRVLSLVRGLLEETYGNPSSSYGTGRRAAEALEAARAGAAGLVGRGDRDVVFTSGASEALLLAILGTALADRGRPNVIVTAVEHKAALSAARLAVGLSGGQLLSVPVHADGQPDLGCLDELCDSRTALVVAMHANNETGVVCDLAVVAEIARREGAAVLSDMTQSAGKIDVRVAAQHVDLAVFSSHKLYGPKGAGALVVTPETRKSMVSIFHGGGQERGLRGGTENVPAIAGFGLACEIAMTDLGEGRQRVLTERLVGGLSSALSDVQLLGGGAPRLPQTANIRFVGADAQAVMANAPTVEISTGSACQSAIPAPSHVLTAMGLSRAEAEECLRFSVGRFTTDDEIEEAIELVVAAVERVRALSAA